MRPRRRAFSWDGRQVGDEGDSEGFLQMAGDVSLQMRDQILEQHEWRANLRDLKRFRYMLKIGGLRVNLMTPYLG